jgi:hypothetical protein
VKTSGGARRCHPAADHSPAACEEETAGPGRRRAPSLKADQATSAGRPTAALLWGLRAAARPSGPSGGVDRYDGAGSHGDELRLGDADSDAGGGPSAGSLETAARSGAFACGSAPDGRGDWSGGGWSRRAADPGARGSSRRRGWRRSSGRVHHGGLGMLRRRWTARRRGSWESGDGARSGGVAGDGGVTSRRRRSAEAFAFGSASACRRRPAPDAVRRPRAPGSEVSCCPGEAAGTETSAVRSLAAWRGRQDGRCTQPARLPPVGQLLPARPPRGTGRSCGFVSGTCSPSSCRRPRPDASGRHLEARVPDHGARAVRRPVLASPSCPILQGGEEVNTIPRRSCRVRA